MTKEEKDFVEEILISDHWKLWSLDRNIQEFDIWKKQFSNIELENILKLNKKSKE